LTSAPPLTLDRCQRRHLRQSWNNFAAIFTVTNAIGTTTSYLDVGGATNAPARYYRVRLVP
jgi:hypothetical protein